MFLFPEYRYINLSDSSLFVRSFEKYKAGGRSISVKVLKPDVLTPGASYMFRLNVHDGTSVGSSTMIVTVRNGITSGGLEVSTTTLEELQDVTLRGKEEYTEPSEPQRNMKRDMISYTVQAKCKS